ncbi:hypothetical protein OHB26_03850 [Nocardia sp. NBC_01503]|uniref:hypothetical protein n=1 Tax=Nocardia sp. NBC_01503 TaxID=2975997 RepID=UPI002E7BC404|nr:hypothetical protein [Nocardia sp. NBC_01503]WTL33390.1 hypothetical protein OHB26_03850 [Nocardia sp. NBC_01503]
MAQYEDHGAALERGLPYGTPFVKKVETSACLVGAPCIRCDKKATPTLEAQWKSLDAIRNEHDYLESIRVHSCSACVGTVAGLILHNIDPRAVGDWLILG